MTIVILLIPYILFLLVWFFFSFFALYHLMKFGVQNVVTFSATFLYIATSVILLFLSFSMLVNVNWAEPLFQGFDLTPPSFSL